MDINKSTVTGDIPAKFLKKFAKQISLPMTDVINTSLKQGCWPDIFKMEIVGAAAVILNGDVMMDLV